MKLEEFVALLQDASKSKNYRDLPDEVFRLLEAILPQAARVLEFSRDEIWITDLSTKMLFSFGAIERTFGFTAEERLQMNIADIFTPESLEKISGLHPEQTHIFLEARHKNGSKVFVEMHGDLIYDDEDNPIGIIGITRDITKEKISEDKYLKLINSTGDMVLVVQDWIVKFANRYVVESTGFAIEEIVGKSFTDFVHPDDRGLVADYHRKRMQGEIIPENYFLRTFNKAGDVRIAEVLITPTEFENAPAFLIILRDKTMQLKEQAIEKARASLFEHSFSPSLDEFLNRALQELENISDSKISCFHFIDKDCKNVYNSIWRNETGVVRKSDYPISANHFSFLDDFCSQAGTIIRNHEQITPHEMTYLWNNTKVNREIIVPLVRSGKAEAFAAIGNKDTDYTKEEIEAVKKLAWLIFGMVIRKKTDEILSINEERFRQISDFAKTVVWEIDSSGLFTYVSNAAISVWDYEPDELINRKYFFDLIPAVSREDFKQVGYGLMSKHEPFAGLITQLEKKNGQIIWVQRNGAPIFDHKGKLLAYRGTDNDITTEIEINKTLRKSEEKYRQLVENINEVLFILDLRGTITYISPVIKRISGFNSKDYYEKNITAHIHQDDIEEFKIVNGFLNPKQPLPAEFRLLTKTNRECIVRSSFTPIYEDEKLSAYSCLIQDITESHRAIREIEESEERFRMIALCSNDFMYEIELQSKRMKWFGNAGTLWNELPIPATVSEYLEYIHPDDLMQVQNTSDEAIAAHKPWTVSYRLLIPGKPVVFIKGKGSASYRDGKPFKGYGSLTDVTQEVLMLEDLKNAKEKAEEANKLKSAFLANMSHELRTPLHHVLGFSQILLENDDPELAKQFALDINTSGSHLLEIIDEILTLTRLDKKNIPLKMEHVQLLEFITSLTGIFSQYFRTHALSTDKIKLRFKPDQNIIFKSIYTDKSKLMHILTHLFKNAVKFTHEGFIEFGAVYAGSDKICFYVQDTGIGIAPEHQKMIFERFNQVENGTSRNYEGIGIGLTIAQMLSELLSCKLHFTSEPEKGSAFFVDIPISF